MLAITRFVDHKNKAAGFPIGAFGKTEFYFLFKALIPLPTIVHILQSGFRESDDDATRSGASRRRIPIHRREAPQMLLSQRRYKPKLRERMRFKVAANRISSTAFLFFGPFVLPPLRRNLAFISRSSSMKSIFSVLYSIPTGLTADALFESTRAASPQSWVIIRSPGSVMLLS